MSAGYNDQPNCAVREKVANQLLSMCDEAAKLAETTASRAMNQLACVTREPVPETIGKAEGAANWPPFLSEIRDRLWSIQKSLRVTNDVLDRLEI